MHGPGHMFIIVMSNHPHWSLSVTSLLIFFFSVVCVCVCAHTCVCICCIYSGTITMGNTKAAEVAHEPHHTKHCEISHSKSPLSCHKKYVLLSCTNYYFLNHLSFFVLFIMIIIWWYVSSSSLFQICFHYLSLSVILIFVISSYH